VAAAAAADGGVTVWEAAPGQRWERLASLLSGRVGVAALEFAPEPHGLLLAVASRDGWVRCVRRRKRYSDVAPGAALVAWQAEAVAHTGGARTQAVQGARGGRRAGVAGGQRLPRVRGRSVHRARLAPGACRSAAAASDRD